MFSLIMGGSAATQMGVDRVFEHTDDDLAHFFMAAAPAGRTRLESLPTLVLPELQDPDPAFARVGHIENLSLGAGAREWRYRFTPNPAVAPIPLAQIRAHAEDLHITNFEGNRTHWAIKPVELYATLAAIGAVAPPVAPTAFKLPTDALRDPDLLAVMMPFAGYDAVYETLRASAADVGMRCARADDIWEKEHILDDVLSLIWKAGVVVADFTGRNANVFYEAGISHTIGRTLVPITQSMSDVPFDLRHIRALVYLNNGEGRESLHSQLTTRLRTLRARQ